MTNTALATAAPSIEIINGQPTTTSLDVARHFRKRHDDVLKRIRSLDCSADFYARNFAEIQNDVDLGMDRVRKDPAFRLTRDGFVFLCMGFTGKEAARWKEAYINRFNEMERELLAAGQLPHQTAEQQLSQWVQDQRWLLFFDNGKPTMKALEPGSVTVPMHQWPEVIKELIVPDEALLARIATVCTTRLEQRINYQKKVAAANAEKAKVTSLI